MKWKYFVTWLPGIPIAIINGSIREYVFRLYMGELSANQVSVISFLILFGIYVWFILPWLKPTSNAQVIKAGFSWFILTVIFEFIFGHFIMGHPWERLFYEYNLFEGRLWIIVLIWIFIAPRFIYHFRYKNKRPDSHAEA